MTESASSPRLRPFSRLIVLVIFLGVGIFTYWLYSTGPQTSSLVFVLTKIEIPAADTLLRHEHVTRLRCKVMNEAGEVVATIVHKRPGAVSSPAEFRVPTGKYMLHIELNLRHPSGETRRQRYLKTVELAGEQVTIHL